MNKFAIGALAALFISGAASEVSAQNLVKNGNFETTTLTTSSQFKGNDVANWSNATTAGYTGYGYNFLVKSGTADTTGFTSLGGNVERLYGPNAGTSAANYAANGFTGVSPTGGNFLLSDADTGFHGAISQAITGLVAGNTYTLTFDWAAASWAPFNGVTTEHWDVSLGGVTKSTETVELAPKGFSGWKTASIDFVAGGANQTLSFLAQGTPIGQPPTLLLDNVSLTAAVPEPGTWMTMLLGFAVVGGAVRRRKVARPQLV